MKTLGSLTAAFLMLLGPQAVAEDDDGGQPDVSATTTPGGLSASLLDKGDGQTKPGSGIESSGQVADGPTFQLGDAACPGATALVESSLAVSVCQQYAEPATPVLTVGLIRNAFAELKLPAGTLVIQPPDGLTLVNFDTNFYTTSTQPIARTVTLLGRRVTLEATPSTFHWTFGDGQRLSTSEPGAPYPALTVTHNYLSKGTYRPALGTTYTGRYRVSGGPWRQIPGTVTINGTSQALRAIEAQPRLVSY